MTRQQAFEHIVQSRGCGSAGVSGKRVVQDTAQVLKRQAVNQCYILYAIQHCIWLVMCIMSCCTVLSRTSVHDPVDGSPAVLMKKRNITKEKQAEMQLEERDEALQR